MYRAGDVIQATKVYSATGKEAKHRWFVFLGRVNFTCNPRNVFLCTTTTQMKCYLENKNATCVTFSKESSCFTEDCLLCLDEIEDSYTESEFDDCFAPEFRGRISDEKLKEIARKIEKADLSKIVIHDILDSFRRDGIQTK